MHEDGIRNSGMANYTPHQARYFAEQILLKRSPSSLESLTSAMSGVKVDLTPHQVDAALFALRSPLSNGALLADEVGLGKTIEAGLVLAQFWSERKRKILLIVPASLRTQWRAELEEKFFIPSTILESSGFNSAQKTGAANPFDIQVDTVVICSFPFAAKKMIYIANIPWDLVIVDEAHRLRNVYKPNNVTGRALQSALMGKRKLLLTATPLQNNLMELFGLVSIIDDHVFGDSRTFREMYVNAPNEEVRNHALKLRLGQFCKRTLRKQVTESVNYTNRMPILQEYTPTADEEKLYNQVSDYLRSERLFALPQGQRNLITLVLRKLLASSSYAISGTLNSLIGRLENLLEGIDEQLSFDDYDVFSELVEEGADETAEDFEDAATAELKADREAILSELAQLREYATLAESIDFNSKGENLLTALKKGFEETERNGGQRKAVIFTESRRTQDYLLNLLNANGYEGDIVFLNGSNNDAIQLEFDLLQEELSDRINEKMSAARQSILENFDEEVAARLKGCHQDTLAGLDKFSRWLYDFFIIQGAERVEPLNQWRFAYTESGRREIFNVNWKEAEEQGDVFLRREQPLCQAWLEEALAHELAPCLLRFDNTGSAHNISFLNEHPGLRGQVSIDKLVYQGVDTEEHILISVTTEDGTVLDDDLVDRMLELPAEAIAAEGPVATSLADDQQKKTSTVQAEIERLNKQYYVDECAKLDAYSEDLKEGLQRDLKMIRKVISEKKKAFKHSTDKTLEEMLSMKDEINRLQEREKLMKRDLFEQEDEIDRQNDALQEEIRKKLDGTFTTESIMAFAFEVV